MSLSLVWMVLSNRWAQLIGVALASYFYAWSQTPDIDAIRKDVRIACDAQWKDTLNAARIESDKRVVAAEEAAKAEPPVPTDRAERVRECNASPTCRDRSR